MKYCILNHIFIYRGTTWGICIQIYNHINVHIYCVTEILELQREALVVFFPGIQLITERGAVVLLLHINLNCVTHISRYAAIFRRTHPVLVLALLVKLNTTKHGFRLRPEVRCIVWLFLIPCPVLWYQYLEVLRLLPIFIQYFTF